MNQKKKQYLYFLIFILIGIIIIFIINFYLFFEIKKASNELALDKNKLSSLESSVENGEELNNIYQNYKQRLEETKAVFASKDRPYEFTEFLKKTALASSISINSPLLSNSSQKSNQNTWDYFNVEVRANGEALKFLKFLEKLENSPYLIEVNSLNVQKLNLEAAASVTANLSLKVYVK